MTARKNLISKAGLACVGLLAIASFGCGTASPAPRPDGGTDGSRPVPCGAVTCGGGQVCCNASCGICAAPGGSCPAIACEDGGVPDGGTCGGETCGAGEPCCYGCAPGEEFCAGPYGCPDIYCPPPPVCGGEPCDGSAGCCMGCCGEEFCGGPDGSCPALDCSLVDCPPPPTCADGTACPPSDVCCDNPCDGSMFCSPAGAGCPVFDCPMPGPCVAQDAQGDGGVCDGFFGYAWNGTSCQSIIGCGCVGADCDSIFMDMATCQAEHAACPGRTCGGFIGATCASGEYCDYGGPSGVSCGAADGLGVCTARPPSCTREYLPVCGCDGRDYDNACIANLNGTDVATRGTCAEPAVDCRTTGCAAGESCFVCGPPGTGFSCVPDGMVCAL